MCLLGRCHSKGPFLEPHRGCLDDDFALGSVFLIFLLRHSHCGLVGEMLETEGQLAESWKCLQNYFAVLQGLKREMSNYWHSQQRWVSSSDYSWSAPVYARSQRIFSSATSFRPSWKWRSSMSLIIGWRVLHSSS